MTRTPRKRAQQSQSLLYMMHVLAYTAPSDTTVYGDEHPGRTARDEYAYYSHIRPLDQARWADRASRMSERFLYMAEPLSWQELEAARLVPANLHTRLQLALAYDQHTCQEIPMIWTTPHGRLEDSGEMLAWYPAMAFWGATKFSKREGRMGTNFAKTREPLVEACLRRGYIPHPFLLEGVQELPGMQDGLIEPVLLAQTEDDLLHTLLLTTGVGGVTNRDPWLLLPGWPPEWIVSLFCEDRRMTYSYASATVPTLEQVMWHLLSVARATDRHPGGQEWVQVRGEVDEMVPYQVCLRQVQEVEAVLGPAYSEALALVQDRAQGLLVTHPADQEVCS